MSSIPTPSSSTPTAQSASGNGNKPSLRDLIRRYLFCDHDDAAGRGGGNEVDDNGNELSETPGSRLEWTLDNKDRFWRKERDLGLSLEDANGLKTLDHTIAELNPGSIELSSETLHAEKPIELDFFIKPDGYGPCIQLSYAIPTGPGRMQVVYIGGSFAELAEKARAGLHHRPTLRTPSESGSQCKSFGCTESEADLKAEDTSSPSPQPEKTYADASVQADPIPTPVSENENEPEPEPKSRPAVDDVATALAVASVTEPGDEEIVKKLDVSKDIPAPESDTHSQAAGSDLQ